MEEINETLELSKSCNKAVNQVIELTNRINKAIEFMKKEKLLPPDYQYDWDDYSWAFNSIVKILKGEDDEQQD